MDFPLERVPQKEYIYCSIFSLANRLQLIGDRREEELTTRQCFVLANIALFGDYALNLKDTARLVGTSSQNVKKIISILEKKGYALLAKDESDGRNLRVALTPKGKAFYEKRVKREEQYVEQLFKGIDEHCISEMYEGLRRLMENALIEEGEN